MWDSVVAQAKAEKCSVSAYLLKIHCEHLNCLGNDKWDEHKNIGDSVDDFLYGGAGIALKDEIPKKQVIADLQEKVDTFIPNPKKGKKKK
jgi:hypothetical protein